MEMAGRESQLFARFVLILSTDRGLRLLAPFFAPQERFRSLIPSYIRDSSVAVVVYDITSELPPSCASRSSH